MKQEMNQYGNGNQLVQCKCVQDKMKFRMGEIIRGEIIRGEI